MKGLVHKTALAALLLLVLTALVAFRSRAPESEPVHEGLPFREYLATLTYGDLRQERQATEAIRAIGSNGVPHLIRILTLRETRLRAAARTLVNLQSWVRPHTVPLQTHQRHALMACQILGPASAPAVPAVAAFVHDPDLASLAVRALAFAGPQTFPLLTNLLGAGIPEARIEAAGDLRYFPPGAGSLGVLLQALRDDPHPTVRARAADTLGVIQGPSALVVPALMQSLSDEQAEVRHSAIRSLGRIGPQAAEALPALLAQLEQEQPNQPGDLILREALRGIGGRSFTILYPPTARP